jgi:hypothetical protein
MPALISGSWPVHGLFAAEVCVCVCVCVCYEVVMLFTNSVSQFLLGHKEVMCTDC